MRVLFCVAVLFSFRVGCFCYVSVWLLGLRGLAVAGVAYCLCVVWRWIWILVAAFD